MFRVTAVFSLILIFVACAWAETVHRPLLPRPQQIQYGAGQLSLRNLAIEFSSPPNDDDRFAGDELSESIAKRTGVRLPLGGIYRSGTAIVMDRTGEANPLPVPGERPGPESREAYDLTITSSGINIRARSSTGIFYGVETLTQMVEGSGQQAVFPNATIHDWPSLAYRGTMVDMSHGPLPSENEIKRQLDFLARWKDNQYYLYSEASIELAGYPSLNPGGRLSKAEVERVVAYGRIRHIDVIPFCDLYGHMHDLFRIERYADLADLPHGTEFDPRNPKVLPLLSDWAGQISQLFPSPFTVIGFDETFQAEMGEHVGSGAESTDQLFVKQITEVAGLFQQHGKHVMAFSDIMSLHPELIHSLPPGLIAIPWHFTSEDKDYKHQLAPLVANHVPHFVQPGLMSWAQIAPDYDTSFDNIDTFLAAGRKSGAQGMINSLWADDAQILYRMCFPGVAYAAAAAWQSEPMDRLHFFSDYAQVMYPESVAPDVASALVSLNQSETSLQKVLGQQTMFAFWERPFFPVHFKSLAGHESDLRQTRLHAEDAERSLLNALSHGGDSATLNSLLIVSRMLDYAGERFQTPLDLADLWSRIGPRRPDADRWWNDWESMVTYQSHSHLVDLMDAVTELRKAYRAEYLTEYTPYRLDSALGRWDAEYQYWRGVQEKLQEFSESSKEGDLLPPLDQVIDAH